MGRDLHWTTPSGEASTSVGYVGSNYDVRGRVGDVCLSPGFQGDRYPGMVNIRDPSLPTLKAYIE